MYTLDAFGTLLDSGDHDAAHTYLEEFVDRIPRNENEAREHVALAVEVASTFTAQLVLKAIDCRTSDALITLRRLEREARAQVDPFDPPLRREERVLRSLIAYMARPVLVRSAIDG